MNRACNVEVKRADWDEHRRKSCIRKCEHEGCGRTVIARLLSLHVKTCQHRAVTCDCGQVGGVAAAYMRRLYAAPSLFACQSV
jgi:hypothetical protein